ncbi:hypothetical protein HY629_00535 [Candidatus Uhrbacteria bacterium]|nr:hypothetical protein [Candidatus Uhrbacteria bacterium]
MLHVSEQQGPLLSDTSPQSSEAVLRIHRNDLKPEVRAYADNLREQVRDIWKAHGVKNLDEFEAAARAKTISRAQVKEVHDLLARLRVTLDTGTLPEEEKRKRATLHIPDALNPYHEALKEGGITDPTENPERLDRTIDLQTRKETSTALSTAHALSAWATSIDTADFTHLTSEKRTHIESLVKDGWEIIAIMPGKEAQLANLTTALQTLKPLWIKDGKEAPVDASSLWDHLETLIDQKATALTEHLPDRPYLLLTPPTQKPPDWTTDKTLEEQNTTFMEYERTYPDVHAMNPAEYATTQAQYTRTLHETTDAMGHPLTTLNPLDITTWTRFINVPLSSFGHVPDAGWVPDNHQLQFGGDGPVNRDAAHGFRLAVRLAL